MKIRLLTPETLHDVAKEAADVLSEGGVILFPTDTLYGLGADALSTEAVQKIYTIKGRDPQKPIHAIIPDRASMTTLGTPSIAAEKLAVHFLPGPLTLILRKLPHLTTGIASDIETIGIRIPHHPFCRTLSENFPKPITATSANLSGMETQNSVETILAQLREKAQHIDFVIDAGTLPPSPPSTVVDMTSTPPIILRNGIIPESAIIKALE